MPPLRVIAEEGDGSPGAKPARKKSPTAGLWRVWHEGIGHEGCWHGKPGPRRAAERSARELNAATDISEAYDARPYLGPPTLPPCDLCGGDQDGFGAVFWGPPDSNGFCKKWHVCIACYRTWEHAVLKGKMKR